MIPIKITWLINYTHNNPYIYQLLQCLLRQHFSPPGFSLGSNRNNSLPCCSSKNKPLNLGNHIWHATFLGLLDLSPSLCLDNQIAIDAELQLFLWLILSKCHILFCWGQNTRYTSFLLLLLLFFFFITWPRLQLNFKILSQFEWECFMAYVWQAWDGGIYAKQHEALGQQSINLQTLFAS